MAMISILNPLANNPESKGNLWVGVTIPLFAITMGTVGVRVWWRRKVFGQVSNADLLAVVSLFCAALQEVLGCIAILKWGLGHHMAYLGVHRTRRAMMYFYVYQISYKILVGTTKISFIFLYLDLFPIPKFTVLCHVLNVSIVAAMIAYSAGTVFQCTPIPFYWNKSIEGGRCINSGAFWYGHAAWNTSIDILVLILPIPVIRSLQMDRNQKLAMFGVFGLGAFVIVASIMRMIALNPASKTEKVDITYVISISNAFLWTQVESCVAIICVCLPTLKGPLTRLLPNLFSKIGISTRDPYSLENIDKMQPGSAWKDSSPAYAKNSASNSSDRASSQERIIGIMKTVEVEITQLAAMEPADASTTASEGMFRAGR